MSEAYYDRAGLRFWNEQEIEGRDSAIRQVSLALRQELQAVNAAWTFHRIEGPILTPCDQVSPAYDSADIFITEAFGKQPAYTLRPETTASSYLVARKMHASGLAKFPFCVWQAGKSFRRETNDGASAAKLRFNEFWQLEFQCIYTRDTKADYRARVLPGLTSLTARLTGCDARVVPSDRLPAYSDQTDDIEVLRGNRWTEMASISTRTDFGPDHLVLEVAFGLDRLVSA